MLMISLLLGSAILPQSLAAEPAPTLELTLVDPGGQETALSVPVPWEATYSFPTDKLDYELAISAALDEDGKLAVSAVVSELKKGKSKPVSNKKAALKEGRKGEIKASFMAPKGMKDAQGHDLSSLHWSFEGAWMLNGDGAALEAPPVADGEYVMVWPDAPLYTAPEDGAPAFRLSESPRLVTESRPLPLRLLGEEDGWLALELPAADPVDLCGAARPELQGLGLRVYAEPSALSQVLTRQVVEGGEGFEYTLNPGVAVQCDASGRCALSELGPGGEIQAVLVVPEDAVGDRFTPIAALPQRAPIRALKPKLPGAVLAERSENSAETTAPWVGVQSLAGVQTPVATVGGRCTRYTLSVLPSQLAELPAADEDAAEAGLAVAEGAALYWGDGREAGEVLGTQIMAPGAATSEGRRCWALGLAVGDAPVQICVDQTDLQ